MATCLLVVGNAGSLSAGDTILRNRIIALGHTVTNHDDNSAADLTKDFVVIAESCGSVQVGTKYATFAGGVILLEPGNLDEQDMALSFDDEPMDEIDIIDSGHPLAAGKANGRVTVLSSAGNVSRCHKTTGTQRVAPSALLIAEIDPDVAAHDVWTPYFAYETGATMHNSHVAEGRRVHLGFLKDATSANWTSDALDFFDAAVTWIAPAGVVARVPYTNRMPQLLAH